MSFYFLDSGWFWNGFVTPSGTVGWGGKVCWEASGKVFLAKKETKEEMAPFCLWSLLCPYVT